jgi:hypothetical protein
MPAKYLLGGSEVEAISNPVAVYTFKSGVKMAIQN